MESEYILTIFSIPKMDCPSEERTIQMALENVPGIEKLTFDLTTRQLRAVHTGPNDALMASLVPLGLGAQIQESRMLTETEEAIELAGDSKSESKVLWLLLGINAAMFVLELVLGIMAQSTGLIADSLDMFADAAVYGLSLFAVGKALSHKRRAAQISGYLQALLAIGAFCEVVRRFFHGSEPEGAAMIAVATLALVANVTCMLLLMKHRKGAVHMRASWIFSTNDVIANAGVILAGVLVWMFQSAIPDLAVGTVISGVVLFGALRILKVSRS